jgi:4-coumarate--CoA ligase
MPTLNLIPRPYTAPSDDLTVPEFIFDYKHPHRPARPSNLPCMINDETGREVYLQEVSGCSQGHNLAC